VLRSLHDTLVPVPEVTAEDAGDPPDVPPLFVMSFVDGSSLEPLFDRDGDDEPSVVANRMRNAARALAVLHSVRPARVGLADEPVVTLAEEVERWCQSLETVDDELVRGWPDVATRLRAAAPPPRPPAIVHGDFRLGNLLAVGPTVTAIVDWEIWSVGDPRVDLGWFLVNADPATYRRETRYATELPAPEALLDAYADELGFGVTDVAWFRALACFKSTATWSLIMKHNRRRSEPDAETEAMTAVLPDLLDRAHAFLD
jgi:aminoglycoside phosphotransferase (APT) family kinase protein